jgi:hypothetical protein
MDSVPADTAVWERASKIATVASVAAILVVTLLLHPDITWGLRGAALVGVVLAVLFARRGLAPLVILSCAPLAPALLRLAFGREGPVLDLVWLAPLAAMLVREASWTRWRLPVSWALLLGGWALTLSLAWPVLLAREIGFDLRVLRDTAVLNSWSNISAPHAVHWMLYVVLTQLVGLLWLERVMAVFRTARRLPLAAHGIWVGPTLASLVAIYQGTGDLGFLSTPFWAEFERATGTMLDANAYGMAAAIGGIIGFLALQGGWAGAGVLGLNMAGMWMAASRTALLCAAAGMVGLIAARWYAGRTLQARSAGAVIAAVAAVALALGLATGTNPIERLGPALEARALWDRAPYGPIALDMIEAHPLTGVGAGSYHVLAGDYDLTQFVPFDNAQNWWRHQLAELGLPAFLPLLVWSLLVGWLVLSGRTPESPLVGGTLRALLLGVGAASLVGMPTQHPFVLLGFLLAVGWLAVAQGPSSASHGLSPRTARAGWAVVTLVAIAYAASHVALAMGPLEVAERARRTGRDYIVGTYPPELLDEWWEVHWTRAHARFIRPTATPWLALRLLATHPDLEQQPVHVRLSTPCGVLVDEPLATREFLTIGVKLPEPLDIADLSVSVSRTWKAGPGHRHPGRRLGVGVVWEPIDRQEDDLAGVCVFHTPQRECVQVERVVHVDCRPADAAARF